MVARWKLVTVPRVRPASPHIRTSGGDKEFKNSPYMLSNQPARSAIFRGALGMCQAKCSHDLCPLHFMQRLLCLVATIEGEGMGPVIILDKSAFQSFSRREHFSLHFHFLENPTPILGMELLADLKKPTKSENRPSRRSKSLRKSSEGVVHHPTRTTGRSV